jgi:hypothetical protein
MPGLGQVAEALATRQAEIGRAIAARLAAEIPEYARAPETLMADVLDGATATVGLLARAFEGGVGPSREELAVVRERAARRVHQGVSLEVFLHAYRVALFEYWDACAEEAARLDLSRDASLQLARLALDAMDLTTTHAAEGYLREETRVRTQSGRVARDLVERLLRGQPPGDLRRDPSVVGLDASGSLVTIVGRVEAASVSVGDALQLAREALEASVALGKLRPLVAIREGEIVLVGTPSHARLAALRAARRRALDDHGVDVRYGVSVPAPGFAGVERAYREAVLALSYTSPARAIVSLHELSALEVALVGANATTRAVITAKARGIRELPDEDVVTIRAFADADLNVSRAAEALGVHPNTVRYRLQRIAAGTDHDPRTFSGLVELICVLETI